MIPTNDVLVMLVADTYSATPAGEVYDVGMDRAVITRLPSADVISLRGTDNAAGWISDFKIKGVRSSLHPQIGICEDGFLAGALALYAVLRGRAGINGRSLIIAAHSRGAGMGPELAALFLLDGIKAEWCLLLETPWCVGEQCRDLLLNAGIPGLQTWHGDDPVPCIPPVSWLLPNVWPIRHFGEWTLDPFDSHLMAGIVTDRQLLVGP
jgi:hypothetical protein